MKILIQLLISFLIVSALIGFVGYIAFKPCRFYDEAGNLARHECNCRGKWVNITQWLGVNRVGDAKSSVDICVGISLPIN